MKYSLAVLSALLFVPVSSFAEIAVSPKDSTSLSVTVYNGNTGLIKDVRKAKLNKGVNTISFSGISARIRPETALFIGKDLTLREQNFNFDLLSRQSLLQKYLGKTIKVVSTNPATGAEKTEAAKVLSVDNGLILQIGDRIETDYSGRLIFPDIPSNLREKPTLIMDVNSTTPGERELSLNYLTDGLSWKADYVLSMNNDETLMDLNSWVTLTNTSGADYINADMQFVAGDLNMVRPSYAAMGVMRSKAMLNDAAIEEAAGMSEESLMDYHLYNLGRKTDILSNQTKQLALFSKKGVSIKKLYHFENLLNRYGSKTFKNVNAKVFLTFLNKKENNLGVPLPAGIVRAYRNDSKGRSFFVGEDRIKHMPENSEVKLTLGDAFDVTAEGKETTRKSLGINSYEAYYSITFKNAKDYSVKVDYYQFFPNDWKITSQLQPEKFSSSQAKWNITVPAKGNYELNFSVRVKDRQ